ncbi:hypothetical protein PVAND_001133 [Polypedilum vanderplanki]|uniref:Transmembrane protein 188 n=1 Tax=Polypedilum vanderplanki TaxID=319348 RepID=A0A9J6BMF1_POLVA|nr:hypothetical protein PVAND_001133 [Polypedilum vanderplanki]
MSLETQICEDLKAFERRLTEVFSYLNPSCLRWRILLTIVSITTSISAFYWISDSKTGRSVSFFSSLLNHPIFLISALCLIILFIYGIHKLVISKQIIVSRTQVVLSDFNMSCNEKGMLILKGFEKKECDT